jgi:hypothetical protein
MPHDELTEYLLHDRQHAKISPEMLEMMGKEAAHRLVTERVALNESIAKLAGAYPDINADQVKRICEFANTAAYLTQHDKAKTAGAQSSYPQFELADPARIVQDLSDGARPSRVTQVDAAYGRLPERKAKLASAESDALFAEIFGVKEAHEDLDFTKTAAVEEVVDVKRDLITLKEHIQNSAQQIDGLFKEASDGYFAAVKEHLLEGGSFADVIAAANSTGASQTKIASAMKPCLKRLIKEGVAKPDVLSAQAKSFTKVAGRVVNEEHPLVSLLGAVLSFDEEIEKIAVGLQDIDVELGNVNTFLKEQLRAGSAR